MVDAELVSVSAVGSLDPTAPAISPDATTTAVPVVDSGDSSTKESEETPEARVLAQGLYSSPSNFIMYAHPNFSH
jgi:hypothetical protein